MRAGRAFELHISRPSSLPEVSSEQYRMWPKKDKTNKQKTINQTNQKINSVNLNYNNNIILT